MIRRRLGKPPAWAIGLGSVTQERLEGPVATVHGRLPEGLRGTFYRNGPARHDLGGRRYGHWFDGDGMVQAFAFTDAGVAHRGRFVETHKHAEETAAGRFLYAAFGTRFRGARLREEPDALNTANTNVVPHHGRLLALWEGGSAHALDPDSLATEGPVTWSEATAGKPFSAHPSVEPDGTMWNFGISPMDQALMLYEIAPDGRLRRTESVPLPAVPLVHDFAVTQRYLVFLLPPMHFRLARLMAGRSILGSYRWEPNHGLRALVVDKADWQRRWWFQLAPGFVFHFGGGWDDGEVVHLDYERYAGPGVVNDFARRIMRGRTPGLDPARVTQARLDLAAGTAGETELAAGSEFPALHPACVGARYRFRYSAASLGKPRHPFMNGLRRLDLTTGAQVHYSFGPERIAEEHVVVPKPDATAEDAAWLVGTVLDLATGRTHLTVFDAAGLADGPVFEAALPYALPLGFHGNFAGAG